MPFTVTGREGSLRWGYRPAAAVSNWCLEKQEHGPGYTLTGVVSNVDAFGVSQRPLTLVVPVASGSWRWPVTTLQIDGTSLTATVGPKE